MLVLRTLTLKIQHLRLSKVDRLAVQSFVKVSEIFIYIQPFNQVNIQIQTSETA
jgi:hypothetical protein